MADPVLSIIIVSYNTCDDLARTLESIDAAPPSMPFDVTVVDNASSDGSAAMVRARWPRVQTIDAGANLGFARANNLGIRATRSELILLLNSDTIVPPGALDDLVAALGSRPDTGVVGPRLVDSAGRAEISYGRMIGPFNELRQRVWGRLYDLDIPLVRGVVERSARRERAVDWVSGACLLVRRADAEAAGLLDERFFLYTEDVDFCASIRAMGKEVRFTPSAEIVHARGRSRRHEPAASHRAYRRSQLAFYEKHHPQWAGLLRVYLAVRGKLSGSGRGNGP